MVRPKGKSKQEQAFERMFLALFVSHCIFSVVIWLCVAYEIGSSGF